MPVWGRRGQRDVKKQTNNNNNKTEKERNQKRDKGKEWFYSCISLGNTLKRWDDIRTDESGLLVGGVSLVSRALSLALVSAECFWVDWCWWIEGLINLEGRYIFPSLFQSIFSPQKLCFEFRACYEGWTLKRIKAMVSVGHGWNLVQDREVLMLWNAKWLPRTSGRCWYWRLSAGIYSVHSKFCIVSVSTRNYLLVWE